MCNVDSMPAVSSTSIQCTWMRFETESASESNFSKIISLSDFIFSSQLFSQFAARNLSCICFQTTFSVRFCSFRFVLAHFLLAYAHFSSLLNSSQYPSSIRLSSSSIHFFVLFQFLFNSSFFFLTSLLCSFSIPLQFVFLPPHFTSLFFFNSSSIRLSSSSLHFFFLIFSSSSVFLHVTSQLRLPPAVFSFQAAVCDRSGSERPQFAQRAPPNPPSSLQAVGRHRAGGPLLPCSHVVQRQWRGAEKPLRLLHRNARGEILLRHQIENPSVQHCLQGAVSEQCLIYMY